MAGRPSVKVQDLENERDARLLHAGGDSGISSTGFAFATDESGTTIAGPLSAVLAVRYHVWRHGIADPGQSDGIAGATTSTGRR